MGDIQSVLSQTQTSDSKPLGKNPENQANEATPVQQTETTGKEKNYTDPKVCHDPTMQWEGIARLFTDQNKVNMENGEDISSHNKYDSIRIDAIEYPLIAINNRNVENHEIYKMIINYDSFLPKLYLEVFDEHQNEQKLNTTQMSGLIRVVMISPVDKVYRKILLNFRITNVLIDEDDPTRVTYSGEYYVEGFRQINTSLIYMKDVCSSQPNCGQGGHINANTWEMLHKIAELSGLGFAATKKCKEIDDRIVRHIYSQRYDKYIEQQLAYSGLGENNIFDAWVDLYGYLVMVNVKWIMDEDIMASDLTINHNVGIHATSNDLMDQEPEETERTLSNYNFMGAKSNAEIASYTMDVNNDSVIDGTLEKIYKIGIGGTKTNYNVVDIQTKQDSIDGDFIEDYNTGKNRPIPRFNFNDDAYTGMKGGYNIDVQKKIRKAYFKKKRQSVLNVQLKSPNFGLQRGTLVNIAIYENDQFNKQIQFQNASNLYTKNTNDEADVVNVPDEMNTRDIVLDDSALMPNFKLTGLYYIDGMKWEYEPSYGQIIQSLKLIKKGITSGYHNKHNAPRIVNEQPKITIQQSPKILNEENIV